MKSLPHPIPRILRLAAAVMAGALFSAPSAPAQLPATEPEPPATRPTASPSPSATPQPKTGGPRTAESALAPFNRNSNRHSEFMERIKEGPVGLLFLGDSITDFWNRRGESSWLKFAPYQPANFGVSGERTEDVLWRIQNGELAGIHPKVTVILIGTNNIGHYKEEQASWAAAGVVKVVQTIHEKLPDTRVLLLGVFPRDKADNKYRAQIRAINETIAGLDDGNKTRYLDIGQIFLDERGEILKDAMPDSLHPNARGYGLWYEAMQPLLTEMMK